MQHEVDSHTVISDRPMGTDQPSGRSGSEVASRIVAPSRPVEQGYDGWIAQSLQPSRCPYHGDVICHLCLARGMSW